MAAAVLLRAADRLRTAAARLPGGPWRPCPSTRGSRRLDAPAAGVRVWVRYSRDGVPVDGAGDLVAYLKVLGPRFADRLANLLEDAAKRDVVYTATVAVHGNQPVEPEPGDEAYLAVELARAVLAEVDP